MWYLRLCDRETCQVVVECYASFDEYADARQFADRHELSFRRCGWYGAVVWVDLQ